MKKVYINPQAESIVLEAGTAILGESIAKGSSETSGGTDAPSRKYRPI